MYEIFIRAALVFLLINSYRCVKMLEKIIKDKEGRDNE